MTSSRSVPRGALFPEHREARHGPRHRMGADQPECRRLHVAHVWGASLSPRQSPPAHTPEASCRQCAPIPAGSRDADSVHRVQLSRASRCVQLSRASRQSSANPAPRLITASPLQGAAQPGKWVREVPTLLKKLVVIGVKRRDRCQRDLGLPLITRDDS
jgi:hypothetical protein